MNRVTVAALVLMVPAGVFGSHAVSAQDCDRQCLERWTDRYLDAVIDDDVSALPVTNDVRFTENGQRLELGDGLWNSMKSKGEYRLFTTDVPAQQVALLTTIAEDDRSPDGSVPALMALRLKIESGRVSEIEQILVRDTAAAERVEAMGSPHPMYLETIPVSQRMSREAMLETANKYFTGMQLNLVGGVLPAMAFAIEGSIPGSVTLVGSGLPAARDLVLYFDVCEADGTCGRQAIDPVTTEVDGTLGVGLSPLPVDGSTLTVCETGTCVITAVFPQILSADFVVATAPVPVVLPEFTVEIRSMATLGTVDNEVVATASVTCDRPTPFSLWAYLGQGDTVWRYRLNGQSCVPGESTRVWIPSRLVVNDAGPFVLIEPVEVELRISPLTTTNVSHETVVGGSSALIDGDEVKVAIRSRLQQPGSEALVAEILRAIGERVAQDAVFRAAFAAAISGG